MIKIFNVYYFQLSFKNSKPVDGLDHLFHVLCQKRDHENI